MVSSSASRAKVHVGSRTAADSLSDPVDDLAFGTAPGPWCSTPEVSATQLTYLDEKLRSPGYPSPPPPRLIDDRRGKYEAQFRRFTAVGVRLLRRGCDQPGQHDAHQVEAD